MTAAASVSTVIVTWNGDKLLADCLDSLRKVYGDALETVVVDNAALYSTRGLVARYGFARYIAAGENLGFAGGNNLGLRYVTRPYVLLLNNDTVMAADSISPLVEFLAAHPAVGIVQGTLAIPGFGLDDCGTELNVFGIQRHLHRGEDPAQAALSPRRVFAAKGAFMMFRRETVAKAGGFLFYDHFRSYYEETDFCHRARNAGVETWFVPTPPVRHLCGATSSRFPRSEVWAQYFSNIFYSFWHNFGWSGRLFTLPVFAVAAFVRSPRAFFGAIGRLGGRGRK